MTSTQPAFPAAQRGPAWSPLWAKVLTWVALVAAAFSFVLGVNFFIQGFGEEALAAVGLIVGPILVILALIVAAPAVLFLRLRGRPLFIITMCTAGLLVAMWVLYGL